jgi:exodeoxyribonuclease-5
MTDSLFQQVLKSNFPHEPNQEQGQLFMELENFLRARGIPQVMVVRGYAGTGKTSVLAAFVKTLTHFKIKTNLMAPTGRAAKVLSAMAGARATTIHRGIYWRKSKSDMSSPLSIRLNTSKNTVFIVDEASMINDGTQRSDNPWERNLLEDLIEHVYQGKGCQLILIGDTGQLPPVGSDESPALDKAYWTQHFPRFTSIFMSLTEVHRQALDSSILLNATSLRSTNWVDYPKFNLHSNSDLIRISGLELQDELEKAYDTLGREGVLVITRSNKAANEYNRQIRARILWFEEELCSGDELMVVKNNYFWQNDSSSIDFIANGETLQVVRIRGMEEMYGFRFYRAIVRLSEAQENIELEVLLHTETLNSDSPALSRDRMKELFFEIEKDYAHIHSKKQRYEEMMKDPYFNALQVKYAYAVTCHKAQGGQWDSVFIDQGYLTDEMVNPDYYRWLYTALTRAQKKAFLVNFKDEFFTQNH